ncbi:seipin-2-like [Chenopodium quinoa]|uniref:seipin-2-like n=1 Tax=Chenopodium quinoa TaxID=63459 RepID=UPI000B786C47|nr:seipin-2-like [Chenopodium quinoa]
MEDAKSTDEDDEFLDASDEFPFYDCPDTPDDSPSTSQSSHSLSSFPNSSVSAAGLCRRKSLRNRKLNNFESNTQKLDSDTELTSETVENESSTVTTDEKPEKSTAPLSPPAKEVVRKRENDDGQLSSSAATARERENDDGQFSSSAAEAVRKRENDDGQFSSLAATARERENDDGQFVSLGILAELLIKAIGFQFNLLINVISFPFWVLYYSCLFALNPLLIIGLGKGYLIGKLTKWWNLVGDTLSPYMSEWLNEHKSWLKLVLRCGWGLFWSVYVCSILVGLLIGAFVIGGLMMRYCFVEEPFLLKQGLNFDYTKSKPVAFVPIISCPIEEWRDKYEDVNAVGYARVIPPNHKLQATVTMVLPESDYNRNLGVFQVRVEFLSENGKTLGSFSHPCMLEFKSQPLRLLLTFFKIVPLVAGYLSETQTLKLKFSGYKEGVIPTACLKITMEQRAEFRPAAGIPEVYDVFVHLESRLPFFKRILWYWRRTLFVWLSMIVFTMELLFALVCCRPVIFPGARTRSNVNRRNAPYTHSTQR